MEPSVSVMPIVINRSSVALRMLRFGMVIEDGSEGLRFQRLSKTIDLTSFSDLPLFYRL